MRERGRGRRRGAKRAAVSIILTRLLCSSDAPLFSVLASDIGQRYTEVSEYLIVIGTRKMRDCPERNGNRGLGAALRVLLSDTCLKKVTPFQSILFPAAGPGAQSYTSVIFMIRSDFAGNPGFLSRIIFFIFS